jgi:hypothetical protein
MIFKKRGRPRRGLPTHTNCRGGLIQLKQKGCQSIPIAEAVPNGKMKNHRNFATTKEVNTVTAEVSSGEDTNAEDIGTPQTKITETSLQKDSNANKKHANPYISPHITHKRGSEDQKHINCS